MSFIAAAVIIGGTSLVASGVGSYLAGKSQKKAAQLAASAQDRATAANLEMYHQSRGSEGSAILPEYAKGTEADLFQRALDNYLASSRGLGSPAELYARTQGDLSAFMPTFDAGTGLVDDIYSGALTDRQLASAKPVAAARTALAGGQKTSLLQAAQETLNRIKAQYPGAAGTFATKMQVNALAPGLQAAANVSGQAALANTEEIRAIQNMRDTLGLQYLNAPLERARQKVGMRLVPTEALAQAYGSQVSPFSMFNIGVGKPPAIPPLPTAGPIPGIGQIVASGIGAGLNTAGNIYANQALAQQIQANQFAAQGYRPQGFYQQAFAPTPTWDSSGYYNTYGAGGVAGAVGPASQPEWYLPAGAG